MQAQLGTEPAPVATVESQNLSAPKSLPKYLPCIDGLRAFAILGVILFHLEIKGMNLGWSGVWLFFVISGFLITGILLESRDRPDYFKNFYARRALRIFPIYFSCLFLLCLAARYIGYSISDVGYYLFYVQNHLLGQTHFRPAFSPAYNHTWTLAVEEQFYLLWPLLVRFLSVRALVATCTTMIIAAPVSRFAILTITDNTFSAMLPLSSNVDALAFGALMAIALRSGKFQFTKMESSPRAKQVSRYLILFLVLLIAGLTAFHGFGEYWRPTDWLSKPNSNILLTTLLSALFAVFLCYVVVWDGWTRRFLASRILVHFGKISYGIYIFHGLVLTYLGVAIRMVHPAWEKSRLLLICGNIIGPYLLALISWHFLESPFLRLKKKFA